MQIRWDPSFLLTTTIPDASGQSPGVPRSIKPAASIRSISLSTNSRRWYGTTLTRCLNGSFVPVFIVCWTRVQRPTSSSVSANASSFERIIDSKRCLDSKGISKFWILSSLTTESNLVSLKGNALSIGFWTGWIAETDLEIELDQHRIVKGPLWSRFEPSLPSDRRLNTVDSCALEVERRDSRLRSQVSQTELYKSLN